MEVFPLGIVRGWVLLRLVVEVGLLVAGFGSDGGTRPLSSCRCSNGETTLLKRSLVVSPLSMVRGGGLFSSEPSNGAVVEAGIWGLRLGPDGGTGPIYSCGCSKAGETRLLKWSLVKSFWLIVEEEVGGRTLLASGAVKLITNSTTVVSTRSMLNLIMSAI